MYADANGVSPKGIYLTALRSLSWSRARLRPAWAINSARAGASCAVSRGDLIGQALRALWGTRGWLIVVSLSFGVGFGTAYPVLCWLCDAGRGRRSGGCGVRRHPGCVRYRDRHRLNVDGLPDSALRLCVRLRRRRRTFGTGPAVFPGSGSIRAAGHWHCVMEKDGGNGFNTKKRSRTETHGDNELIRTDTLVAAVRHAGPGRRATSRTTQHCLSCPWFVISAFSSCVSVRLRASAVNPLPLSPPSWVLSQLRTRTAPPTRSSARLPPTSARRRTATSSRRCSRGSWCG